MPVVTSPLITRPEDAVEMVSEFLEDRAGSLGVEFIGKYDERLIPRYPAIIVSAGPVAREPHGTHSFLVTCRCLIHIYHGDVTETHSQRSLEDLQLATNIVRALEEDKSWDERVTFAYVESELPGFVAPRSGRSNVIVGTRISWESIAVEMWS